ncbi:BmGPI8, Sexual stage antigen, Pfam s48/45 [Babesia caballi]|nr:BmGPI8, Sexual stage antigen, Pfam s48/45 [Babesia caballi]
MDGKTCSVFVSPKDFLIIRGITHDKETLNLLPLDQDKQVFKKLTEKGSPWNIPKLEVSNPDGLEPVKLTKEGTNLTHALYQFAFENIDHNPRYYAWSKDKKQGKGLHYDKIMAVHLSHNWITTGMAGELLISSGHEMVYKVPNKAQFYSLITRGSTGIKFNCSQFFKMKDGGAYKLYPEGKNTFFANVENGKLHPDKIPTMLFHEEFATTGVSIYKAPESEARSTFDLELKYDSGKAIWALHKKPIYFICAKPDWDVKTDSYAVIAVDPFFQLHPIYGCGTRPEFFLNNDGNRNTDKSCNFTLDGERTIGFFCPTPVPKHFLQKDQDQWKPADSDDFATENPYHKMVQCYDRSTTLQKILKPKVDIGLLTKPKSVGELRSLWIFSRSQFLRQGQDPILHILCHCFNVKGEVEASIAVSSGFRKYDRPNAVEPPIANAQTT